MEKVFCTVITSNYLPYVHILYDSLVKYDSDIRLFAFVSDDRLSESSYRSIDEKRIEILYYDDIVGESEYLRALKEKYADTYHDAYRWSMKPVLLAYLVSNYCEKAIYLDSDLLFFSEFSFLFDELEDSSVLLSPHWRSSYPELDAKNFHLNFLDGMYNGGFVGASKKGVKALNYWAMCCLYRMERNREQGLHDDQKYLDILPSRFEGVTSIRHMGCNISNWNQIDCKRSKDHNGRIVINGKYDVVFIHFTKSFFRGVYFGDDTLLKPYADHYISCLEKYNITGLLESLEKEEEAKRRGVFGKLAQRVVKRK